LQQPGLGNIAPLEGIPPVGGWHNVDNMDGIKKTLEYIQSQEDGIIFTRSKSMNIGVRETFVVLSATIAELLAIQTPLLGTSFAKLLSLS
jgi:phosphopentomutase